METPKNSICQSPHHYLVVKNWVGTWQKQHRNRIKYLVFSPNHLIIKRQ